MDQTSERSNKPTYKYCIVPECRNTVRNAPDKLFFFVPRGADIRKKWCKIMKKDMISPTACLYCCEDHFDIEADTENYMKYKILNLEKNQKITLRLKKGIVPHKFQCQNRTKFQPRILRKSLSKKIHLEKIKSAASQPPAKQSVSVSDSTSNDYLLAATSLCLPQADLKDTRNQNAHEAGCNTSLDSVFSKNNIYYVGKDSDNDDLCVKTESTMVNQVFISHDVEKILLQENTDIGIISFQPSVESTSSLCSNTCSAPTPSVEDDSECEKQFNNQMRSSMLTAIEKEPKMLLGLPKRSYYLIKLLSDSIPLPVIDILITLKKIKLNESFSILALQFGYKRSTICRIFSECVLLMSKKMKDFILFPSLEEITNNLPISFRANYANVVSIIDLLEIHIEKPSNMIHHSHTWSQHKNCNALKYLISYTPDGLVNFISDAYSDMATDVQIVKNCGFLECLPRKTAVMADRSFIDLTSLLEKEECTFIRLPSVYKTTPRSREDLKQTQRAAALKHHVQCVIHRLRKFNMLQPHVCVDHNLMPIIDNVLVVACGLMNMQDVD